MQIQSTNQIPMTQPQKAIYTENKADDILSGQHDIYKGDIDMPDIYERLSKTFVQTTTREWAVVSVSLAELRINNTQGWNGKYTGYIFPSSWTQNDILKWAMSKDHTKWHWLPHWKVQQWKRTHKKFITSPEASPEKDI